jgi:hypothetical protein
MIRLIGNTSILMLADDIEKFLRDSKGRQIKGLELASACTPSNVSYHIATINYEDSEVPDDTNVVVDVIGEICKIPEVAMGFIERTKKLPQSEILTHLFALDLVIQGTGQPIIYALVVRESASHTEVQLNKPRKNK